MVTLRLFTAFVTLCCVTHVAGASTEPLSSLTFEELLNVEVETAGKIKQHTDQAPAIISTISRSEISAYGGNSLFEILDRLPGIQMMGSFFYPQNLAVIRGLQLTHSNNEVLILVNGRPLRDSFTGGQHFAIFSAFPVSGIEQIEVIRGPGSVLYGSNAFAGVINVITQTGSASNINVIAGSDNTLNLDGSIGGETLDGHWNIAAKVYSESGWQHSAFDNNGTSGSFDAKEQNRSLVFTGQYQDLKWSTAVWQSEQDFWGATSSWSGNPVQSQRQVKSTRTLVDIGYKWHLNDTQFIDYNLSYSTSHFSHYNYDAKSRNFLVEGTYHNTDVSSGHLLAGATVWRQYVSTYEGLRVAPIPGFSRNWVNAYAQYQTVSDSGFNGFAGIQYNKVPDVDPNWVFRGGLQWQLTSRSGLKLLWGEAFRAAFSVETNFDLIVCCDSDGDNLGGLRGNPSLAPEEITTQEIQYYHNSDNSRWALTLFRSELKNLIERQRAPDRVLDFVNGGSLNSSGLELEWRQQIADHFQINASVTYQQNDSHNIDDYTLMPNWLFKIGVSKETQSGATLGIFFNSQDKFHSNALRNPNTMLVNSEADKRHELSIQYRHPVDWLSSYQSHIVFYVTNALNDDLYQPEIAGRTINTHPAGPGRRTFLGIQTHF